MIERILNSEDQREHIRQIPAEEISAIQAEQEKAERKYWLSIPYGEAVVKEIRKKYDINAELAIQRQRDAKPEEYQEYYDYCESCKAFVRKKKEEESTDGSS